MTGSRKMLSIAGVAAASLAGTPALAHHSMSMFDHEKTMTLDGTVKEFQYTNPHSWVELMVKDPATGELVQWSIEGGPPAALAQALGVKGRNAIKPGDQATIVIHPLKVGGNGGSLLSISVNGGVVYRSGK